MIAQLEADKKENVIEKLVKVYLIKSRGKIKRGSKHHKTILAFAQWLDVFINQGNI